MDNQKRQSCSCMCMPVNLQFWLSVSLATLGQSGILQGNTYKSGAQQVYRFSVGFNGAAKQGSFHMWLLFFKLWRVSIYTADNIVRTPLCNNKSISKCHHLFFDVSFSKYLGKNVSLLLFSCFSSCNLKSRSITKIHFIITSPFSLSFFLSFLCGCAGDDVYHLFYPTRPHVLHM